MNGVSFPVVGIEHIIFSATTRTDMHSLDIRFRRRRMFAPLRPICPRSGPPTCLVRRGSFRRDPNVRSRSGPPPQSIAWLYRVAHAMFECLQVPSSCSAQVRATWRAMWCEVGPQLARASASLQRVWWALCIGHATDFGQHGQAMVARIRTSSGRPRSNQVGWFLGWAILGQKKVGHPKFRVAAAGGRRSAQLGHSTCLGLYGCASDLSSRTLSSWSVSPSPWCCRNGVVANCVGVHDRS